MTPQDKITLEIIYRASEFLGEDAPDLKEGQSFAEFYDQLLDEGWEDILQEARNEIRECGVETGIDRGEWSRHYESEEVAMKVRDGSWVGWTYWHGGGKYGEPEAIDWISGAYDVKCVEEENS